MVGEMGELAKEEVTEFLDFRDASKEPFLEIFSIQYLGIE